MMMMQRFVGGFVVAVAVAVLVVAGSGSVAVAVEGENASAIRPTVLWHGMGDTCCLPFSMGAVKKEIEKHLPDIYVYSIMLGKNEIEDEFEGFFGNVNTQVDNICTKLKSDPNLKNGFNAVGFSQGGQFLRAYVQRCNDPPVHNLVTLGGQHMGVTDIPHCTATNATLCQLMAEALSVGAYVDGIRNYSVQAQYFRSAFEYKKYLEKNIFLADLNNERATKNATYKQNLASLNRFVLIEFSEDTMVVPRESSQFGYFKEGAMKEIVPMRQQPIYTEDWIGLQQLDKDNRIVEKKCPGDHLQFTMKYFLDNVISPFLNNTVTTTTTTTI
ncbi:palmitoyl-protein thioesterase 1 [Salpingoeca rosetta]|uniref:Palmitoyl-protein thioesterase 1 n=1 Tax=Salpingoeca rosetta (strain ATCC 50818 / BSB-021) TaxID=946362 RepID=F2UNI9_SALR5|nr:palmitoyl-protein thioesterase 1 [Salpingoeca rosetta]EGD79194.1 palmitoyl-protein thioesterase 1 [Salpingoeca rosetta]|eukprot:XP_004989279.1 palmitoyl-protein thioesterase 1 [Salpingoeca rosetta]